MRLSSILILLAALTMALAGIGLVMYSRKLTNETASKRIGLIRAGAAGAASRAISLDDTLVRSEQRGIEDVETRETERVLHRFRLATGRAVTVLLAVRLSAVALMGLIGLIVASHFMSGGRHPQVPFLIAMALGIAGWFIPGMVIAKRIKRRTKAIVAGFADALELLVICVEAGLSFEDGIDRISRILAQAQPALAEELATTAADLKILPSREAALTNLASRINMPSVRSVVTTLSQTLRYGTPLAQALRVVAGELRNDSLMRLEERANQLPTLMTIPMMLFIMPTIFMVVAGPAVLKVIDTFKH